MKKHQDKNQENNLSSTEAQGNGIQVGERNLAFEIINSSKYPVKIEFDDFIPEEYYNKKFEEEQKGRRLRKVSQKVRFRQKLREVFIYPEQKIKIPDEIEADIDVPGVFKDKSIKRVFSRSFSQIRV